QVEPAPPRTTNHRKPLRDIGGARTLPHWRSQSIGVAPIVVLTALAVVSFGRLVAHPSALVVDGKQPSVDHANPGEPRPLGNDLPFSLLPHHLSIMRVLHTFGHLPAWDARGFGGRPMIGNPQSGMFYPPVWLAWWSGAPSALGWLPFVPLIWGGLGL